MKVWELLPGFYVRGGTRKYSLADKLAMVEEYKLTMVVCLIKTFDNDLLGMPFYHVLPISDGRHVPTIEAEKVAIRVCQELKAGGRVLIHCHAGRNRSGLVAALVIRRMCRYDNGEQIIRHMRSLKPNMLANPHFAQYVEAL